MVLLSRSQFIPHTGFCWDLILVVGLQARGRWSRVLRKGKSPLQDAILGEALTDFSGKERANLIRQGRKGYYYW